MRPAQLKIEIPNSPGTYQFFDVDGVCIYVGKAKNLRRRLGQYRNARRLKAHRKMRAILKASHRVEIHVLATELEALLEENRMIQALRPRFNCDGAYSFMYPFWGVKREQWGAVFVLTSSPAHYPAFRFFGAYRSRRESRAAFDSWVELTRFLGHPVAPKQVRVFKQRRFDRVHAIRKIEGELLHHLEHFLRGTSPELLERLILALVESIAARNQSDEIQEHIRVLKRFYFQESNLLNRAIESCGTNEYPVPQELRDRLLVRARACGFLKNLESPERETR